MSRVVHLPKATQVERQQIIHELRIIERDAREIRESLERTNFVWLRPVVSMQILHAYQALQRVTGYR